MTVRLTHWRGELPRAVLLALTVALVPAPAIAGGTGTSSSKATPTRTSLQTAVAREAAKLATAKTVARHDEQTTNSTGGTSFFKSKPGLIALVVMGIGTGYAVYSAQHDRVHSPAKQ